MSMVILIPLPAITNAAKFSIWSGIQSSRFLLYDLSFNRNLAQGILNDLLELLCHRNQPNHESVHFLKVRKRSFIDLT